MKRNMISRWTYMTMAAAALIALLPACHDEKSPSLDNGVYIEEAAPLKTFPQQIETLVVENATSQSLTVKLARPVSEDVRVSFELDLSLIDDYNERYGTSCEMIPDEFLVFDGGSEVVIPAGMTTATQNFTVKPYTTPNGESYAVAVRMQYVSGPVEIRGNADHMLYLLSVPHKQKALRYNARADKSLNKIDFTTTMTECTLEFWIKVNNKSPYTFNSDSDWFGAENASKRTYVFGGGAGSSPLWVGANFGLRFWGGGQEGPELQCRADDTNTDFESGNWWKPDTWFHIAYAYDGNSVTLYKDGSVDKVHPRQLDYNFTGLSLANLTGQMEVEIAQLRLWRKCLSQDQLVAGMSRPVPGDSDGLYAYWPCDEGEGTVLHGSGELAKDIPLGGVSWSDKEYNFSHPNED